MDSVTWQQFAAWGLFSMQVALSLGCALHALMNKRESRAAIGWIALCLLAPVAGPLIYIVFGINKISGHDTHAAVAEKAAAVEGNCVTAQTDTVTSLESMLSAISAAHSSIMLSQYIFENHGIGERFIDALGDARKRNVEVYVILDRIGALYSLGSTRRSLQDAGVNVAIFSPFRFRHFPPRLNLRNHRKLMIVDGRSAFVSGMNIRNGYLNSRRRNTPAIRDIHFEFTGPIVTEISRLFARDWYRCTHQRIATTVSSAETSGDATCRITEDGPDNSVDFITMTLISAINDAQSCIRIVSPYFLPPREITAALQVAAQNGIRIDIIVPANNNLIYVHWAMQHYYRELLPYGINVYLQQGSFDHSKLITIDHSRCIVGSVNVDARSLRLNFEVAIEVFDSTLTAAMHDHLDQLTERAKTVTTEHIVSLPFWQRLRNAFAWLGSPYL